MKRWVACLFKGVFLCPRGPREFLVWVGLRVRNDRERLNRRIGYSVIWDRHEDPTTPIHGEHAMFPRMRMWGVDNICIHHPEYIEFKRGYHINLPRATANSLSSLSTFSEPILRLRSLLPSRRSLVAKIPHKGVGRAGVVRGQSQTRLLLIPVQRTGGHTVVLRYERGLQISFWPFILVRCAYFGSTRVVEGVGAIWYRPAPWWGTGRWSSEWGCLWCLSWGTGRWSSEWRCLWCLTWGTIRRILRWRWVG